MIRRNLPNLRIIYFIYFMYLSIAYSPNIAVVALLPLSLLFLLSVQLYRLLGCQRVGRERAPSRPEYVSDGYRQNHKKERPLLGLVAWRCAPHAQNLEFFFPPLNFFITSPFSPIF